jgi:hypothetical protein
MMEATAAPYKVFARFGNAVFKAEGPQEAVKDQFDLFMGVLGSKLEAVQSNGSNGHQKKKPAERIVDDPDLPEGHHEQFDEDEASPQNGEAGTIPKELIERAYRIDGNALSLRVLPQTKDRDADALLLLVYGYHALREQKEVGATQLTASARQSGVMLSRIDRTLAKMKSFVMRGGHGKGTRYQIANPGIVKAEKMLREMFA